MYYSLGNEITTRRPGGGSPLHNGIGIHNKSACGQERIDILCSLANIPLDIHGEPRGLRDGQTEVERKGRRYTAQTDNKAPAKVDGDRIG